MSMQQNQNAQLNGYQGPIYPDNLKKLHLIFAQFDKNGEVLHRLCEPLEWYREISRPTTSDGYAWKWAVRFGLRRGLGQIVIAIPWAFDTTKQDGCYTDRLCAVYVWGVVRNDDIEKIIRLLTVRAQEYIQLNT